MSDVDVLTESTNVDAWVEAVLAACNLEWNGPKKNYEREPKEDLRIDGVTPVEEHLAYLTQTSQDTYSRRPEIEGKAKLDRALAKHLNNFDKAFVAVQSNIDKARARIGTGQSGGAIQSAVDQLEFMRDALEAAYYSPAKNPEEAFAELKAKIEQANAQLEELGKGKAKIEDQGAKEEFEDIFDDAKAALNRAGKALGKEEFLEAEDELEEANTAMKDLQPGSSEEIAKRKKEYLNVVDDAWKNIKSLSSKLSSLADEEKKREFAKHKTTASTLVKRVATSLKAGKVKSVRPDIPKLKAEVEKMKDCFKADNKAKAKKKTAGKK